MRMEIEIDQEKLTAVTKIVNRDTDPAATEEKIRVGICEGWNGDDWYQEWIDAASAEQIARLVATFYNRGIVSLQSGIEEEREPISAQMKLERTASADPEGVLCHGSEIRMFPWPEVLALRELVAAVPPEAAADMDYPRMVHGLWAAGGSIFGIVLLRRGMARLFFSQPEWEKLAGLLYVTSPLLSVVEVVALTGKRRQPVTEAIRFGELFAFLRPGLQRRRWRVPRRAAREWAG